MGRRFWWESEYLVSLHQTITIWLPINFVLYLYTPIQVSNSLPRPMYDGDTAFGSNTSTS